MTLYRAYRFGQDGHFLNATDLVCDNDEQATREAKAIVGDDAVLLCASDRSVVRLDGAMR
jgi:hypothetical protein